MLVFLTTHVCGGMHGFRLMSSVFLDHQPLSFGGTRYLHRTENSLTQLNCIGEGQGFQPRWFGKSAKPVPSQIVILQPFNTYIFSIPLLFCFSQ